MVCPHCARHRPLVEPSTADTQARAQSPLLGVERDLTAASTNRCVSECANE